MTTLHLLFIDDCGDDGDYTVTKRRLDGKGGSSKFFTLGGIIVDEKNEMLFSVERSAIVEEFFNPPPQNFKLHYEELRSKRSPYDQLGSRVKDLADRVFFTIKKIDCNLISVTIDIEKHCRRYGVPINVRAYTLFLLLERFQYFLEDHGTQGRAIYEKYNSKLRHKIEKIHQWFIEYPNFPKITDFKNIQGIVREGDPLSEHVLQFADFFTYAPYKLCMSNGIQRCRFDEIKHKYYNLDHMFPYKRGNYKIM